MMNDRVLLCGAWDEGAGYPRTRSLRQGLEAAGIEVSECVKVILFVVIRHAEGGAETLIVCSGSQVPAGFYARKQNPKLALPKTPLEIRKYIAKGESCLHRKRK